MTAPRLAPLPVVALCALALVGLTACGSSKPAPEATGSAAASSSAAPSSAAAPAAADVVGHTWVTATSPVNGIAPLTLIKGTTLAFTLTGSTLTVKPGCHTHTGNAKYTTDGRIALQENMMSKTRESCDPKLEDQDSRWVGFMMDSPRASMSNGTLILTTNDGSQVAFTKKA